MILLDSGFENDCHSSMVTVPIGQLFFKAVILIRCLITTLLPPLQAKKVGVPTAATFEHSLNISILVGTLTLLVPL